jgi:hypothetical protein
MMSRKVPGPHIAFYIAAANWSTALTHLDSLALRTATLRTDINESYLNPGNLPKARCDPECFRLGAQERS